MSLDENGLEVPIHRSITEPVMVAGIPRNLAFVLWTTAAAIALGLHQLWVLPVAVLLHAVFSRLAKRDPYFFDVLLRALRAQRRLLP